jgi:uncharacterized protein
MGIPTTNYLMKSFMDKSKHGMVLPSFWAFVLCFFASISVVFGQSSDVALFPPRPEPAVYVNDFAAFLTPHERSLLEDKLRRYWDSTSTQIVVITKADIGDYDKGSFATELGQRWGIGQKGKDNGIVLLIKTEQPGRGAFIATGYGAEGALPDGLAGQIIRDVMIPRFKAGENFQGVNAGIDAMIQALSGEYQNAETGSSFPFLLILLVFFALFILFAYMSRRSAHSAEEYTHDGKRIRRTVYRNDPWIGGGGFGGGSGGGGGFGGGSFGGGGFGGGGAGGDW